MHISKYHVALTIFLTPNLLISMDPKAELLQIKIQTNDDQEFEVDAEIAKQSMTLRGVIEDRDTSEASSIPLPEISGPQFALLHSLMQRFFELPPANCPEEKEKKLAQQVEAITQLNPAPDNTQLIDLVSEANYLHLPTKPLLAALAQKILTGNEWLQLESLPTRHLKKLWVMHPAQSFMLEGITSTSFGHTKPKHVIEDAHGNLISLTKGKIKIWDKKSLTTKPFKKAELKHRAISYLIKSTDDTRFISWSRKDGTIKIWDKNNFNQEPITQYHPHIFDVFENKASTHLISFSKDKGTIKIWNINDFNQEPATLSHPKVSGVIESSDGTHLFSWSDSFFNIKIWNIKQIDQKPITLSQLNLSGIIESSDGIHLISYSKDDRTIKIWNKNDLNQKPVTLKHEITGEHQLDNIRETLHGDLISWSPGGTIKIWNRNNLKQEPVTLKHNYVKDIIESQNGIHLISWSWEEDTIKIWDKNNLHLEPITLYHPQLSQVIESKDGTHLISWSLIKDTLKIWNRNNLKQESITLKSPSGLGDIIEIQDGDLVSWWPYYEGKKKLTLWNTGPLLNPSPDQISLFFVTYFIHKNAQNFAPSVEKLLALKTTFDALSLTTQTFLEQKAPKFIAAIKDVQG